MPANAGNSNFLFLFIYFIINHRNTTTKGDSAAWHDFVDASNLRNCYVTYDVTVRALNTNEYCKVCISLTLSTLRSTLYTFNYNADSRSILQ